LCSLNENTLASASGENFIRIWDLTARNLKFNLTHERGNKIKFLYRIDNFLMANVCDDVISSIQIWNYRNGTFVASLITVNPIISLITFDERFLVAGLKEGSILIWNLKEKLKLKFTLHSHSGSVLSLCMLQNGGYYLASGSGHPNNLIKIWHMSNGSLYLNQDEHRDNVNVLIRLSKQIFASGSNDKSIKLWKII
jgi:WD40 repeat protein